MLETIDTLAWISRVKTCYDLTQVRSINQLGFTMNCWIANEFLFYIMKQELQNKYRNSHYW